MVKLTFHLESLCATVLMTSQVLEHCLSGTRVTKAILVTVFLPSKDIYVISSTCRLEIISREETICHSSLDPVAGIENRERFKERIYGFEMATGNKNRSICNDSEIAKLLRMLKQLDPMEHQKETDRR